MPYRNCELCKNQFKTSDYLLKTGKGRFCSQSCRSKVVYHISVLKGWTFKDGKHSDLVKKRQSERLLGKSGELARNWKGGISRTYKTGYYTPKYREWRIKVFERDNYTCQKCGVSGNKKYLTAHHIKSFSHYPELRFSLSNGITLCEPCHSKTDNYKGRNNKLKGTKKLA